MMDNRTEATTNRAMKDSTLQRPGRWSENTASAKRDSPIRRVLLAVTELRAGGAERVLTLLAAALRARRIDPLVICLQAEGALAPALRDQGILVQSLDSQRGYDISTLWALRRIVRDTNPDVINAHDRWALLYLAIATRMMRSPPLVFSAHGLMYDQPTRARWRYRLAAGATSATTAVSQEVAARHVVYFGWKRPAEIVPNGVPEPVPSPGSRERLRAALGVPDQAFIFLAVGNVRPEKGFEDLLEAAARLRETSAKQIVVLVGGHMPESDYCARLRRLHDRLDLTDNVRFLGYRNDIGNLYAAADAFVLSSRSEGLPMVMLEAMMAGLPIVATRVGGVPDALQDCGLLVPPEQPDELAGAMGRLLTDPQMASDLGGKAQKRARQEFSLDRMVARYLDVYERVAAQHQRRKER